jgi:hypothetical protein
MVDVDLVAIAASLYARRGTAVIVPIEPQNLAWQPIANDCHNNTDRFVLENPGFKSVRGWRVFDYSDLGFFRFMSHSVISAPDGHLFEITPNPTGYAPPFLRHLGLEGEFEAIVEAGWPSLSHPPGHEK